MKKEKFETMVFDALEKFFSDIHKMCIKEVLDKAERYRKMYGGK